VKFDYALPCRISHPGLCIKADENLWPQLIAFRANLHELVAQGNYYEICTTPPLLHPIYIRIAYARHACPKVVVAVKCVRSELGPSDVLGDSQSFVLGLATMSKEGHGSRYDYQLDSMLAAMAIKRDVAVTDVTLSALGSKFISVSRPFERLVKAESAATISLLHRVRSSKKKTATPAGDAVDADPDYEQRLTQAMEKIGLAKPLSTTTPLHVRQARAALRVPSAERLRPKTEVAQPWHSEDDDDISKDVGDSESSHDGVDIDEVPVDKGSGATAKKVKQLIEDGALVASFVPGASSSSSSSSAVAPPTATHGGGGASAGGEGASSGGSAGGSIGGNGDGGASAGGGGASSGGSAGGSSGDNGGGGEAIAVVPLPPLPPLEARPRKVGKWKAYKVTNGEIFHDEVYGRMDAHCGNPLHGKCKMEIFNSFSYILYI
jgi:hypothetical protein